MAPQKDEARCDLWVCNIFYQQEAAARRQNPGSARRTAANADLAVIAQLEPTGGGGSGRIKKKKEDMHVKAFLRGGKNKWINRGYKFFFLK